MAYLLRLSALPALTSCLLFWPTGWVINDAPVAPEACRSEVFRQMESGARSEAKFLTVVVSTPQVPDLAGSYVRLRVLLGRHPGPTLSAKAANHAVFDLLVRRTGRQLRYWPQLVSIAEDGRVPCQAVETPLLDLGDTLHTAREGRHQTCHTSLETKLVAITSLPGTADTLYRYQVATVASSTHLPHIAGIELDQQLRLRGVLYQATSGNLRRGFRDDWVTYRGQALLTPVHP
jgi:hypothetical protein